MNEINPQSPEKKPTVTQGELFAQEQELQQAINELPKDTAIAKESVVPATEQPSMKITKEMMDELYTKEKGDFMRGQL